MKEFCYFFVVFEVIVVFILVSKKGEEIRRICMGDCYGLGLGVGRISAFIFFF